MLDTASTPVPAPPRPPPLVPDVEDIQRGYERLDCEERVVRGTPARLFTFPGGNRDVSRTVVCLPGLGASGRSFAPMEPLAQAWNLLLWTPPLKTPATHTPLQWNLSVLNHPEAGLPERFALLGSSYGSLLSIAYALEHPQRVKALVLVSPVASVRKVRRLALTLSTLVRAPRPLAYVFAPTVARILGGRWLPPEGRAEIVREARRMSSVELMRRLRDILAADFLHRLRELRVPTLIIEGGRDLLVPPAAARDVAAHVPGAELEFLETASHLPYMSHPEAFNARVSDFLSRHPD
ncbi:MULTISPECIES: alpha/beta fold hydrolase [unclassified Corallococcus]|uniref:alpha/beta fold hydrolase n=1 Tax=unclassified Corallococcus TaxID=2685029 RepID=UPI001CBA9F60|nr:MULTISPECIES: alpha/beta hydrolase [unclassified Corallococcus]MBZ4334749.1 alpha/beta hydrolase [Corallococcus sp. AS-1-12]MBZ4375100.1 alpha/beta hydrolase [Corallococcus sp. AS-1-6]